MKKCQFCQKPATIHLTKMVNKHKGEVYLCEACAREKNLLPDSPQDLNVPAILQLVLEQLPSPPRPLAGDTVCPECGTPYAHFRAQGRLGCAHDYEVFRSLLEPLVDKVQNGAVRHVGKAPARHRRRMKQARRVELEAMLATAVASERYEEAARLRDTIRTLGEDHES
jgi:protein arginine kinase activator